MSLDPQKATLKPDSSFILASSSPRRKDLLQDLISQFEVVSAEVDELKDHPSGPESLVLENAKLKCQKVAEIYPDFWVLGADTLVALGNQVLGKPINIDEAKLMLMRLSSKTHYVYTGISLSHISKGINLSRTVATSVTFQELNETVIENYFRKVNPLDKAGAYAIQTCPEMIIQSYKGSLSNVIGLPQELLREWLIRYGLI
jgi:septum formation protein